VPKVTVDPPKKPDSQRQPLIQEIIFCSSVSCQGLSFSCNIAQDLSFEYKFSLFVLFRVLVGFIVFPTDSLFTLTAVDVPDNMTACSHAAFVRLAALDIDNVMKQIGLAMLASEVLLLYVNMQPVRR
jgi:hypothetical protein